MLEVSVLHIFACSIRHGNEWVSTADGLFTFSHYWGSLVTCVLSGITAEFHPEPHRLWYKLLLAVLLLVQSEMLTQTFHGKLLPLWSWYFVNFSLRCVKSGEVSVYIWSLCPLLLPLSLWKGQRSALPCSHSIITSSQTGSARVTEFQQNNTPNFNIPRIWPLVDTIHNRVRNLDMKQSRGLLACIIYAAFPITFRWPPSPFKLWGKVGLFLLLYTLGLHELENNLLFTQLTFPYLPYSFSYSPFPVTLASGLSFIGCYCNKTLDEDWSVLDHCCGNLLPLCLFERKWDAIYLYDSFDILYELSTSFLKLPKIWNWFSNIALPCSHSIIN